MPNTAEHLPPERLAGAALDAQEIAHLAVCDACQVARRLADLDRGRPPASHHAHHPVLAPGTVVDGKYVVRAVLGRGGMGTVYAVQHRQLGSTHALKVMNLSDPQLAGRLLREGQLQAGLEHANIVRVTDVVTIDDLPGLVMEHIRGPNLAALIEGEGLGSWETRDRIAIGILRGVRAAHRRGWIHRDLKPANILLATDDDGLVPKIADFGLARLAMDAGIGLTVPGSVMGTLAYMAPEQYTDPAAVGPQADVFALGAILYELCTGQRAFGGSIAEVAWEITTGRYRPPRELAQDLPERMERAIVGALVVDRSARFRDVKALLAAWRNADDDDLGGDTPSPEALAQELALATIPTSRPAETTLVTELPVLRSAPTETTPPGRPTRAWWWVAAAGLVAGIGLAVVGIVQLAPSPAVAPAAPQPALAPVVRPPVPPPPQPVPAPTETPTATRRPPAPVPVAAPTVSVEVTSGAWGSVIFLDGVEVGRTPAIRKRALQLPPGKHRIRVERDGVTSTEHVFVVGAGQVDALHWDGANGTWETRISSP